ncbi:MULTISPECIES: hypothetical protein [Pseudomonas]|jgi:hypothetical protein|uniref:Uncharacterized protein n=1 Tax=Pseudomonas canavaninivorans TaxID=2842348 RepID=A0ABX8QFC4_PSECO|nr:MULTISPECIES: hypothetical protein [Pseudomonas]MBJ2345899.1 hypothetical protein [Pseudomonas canavaninivorans]MBL3540849.1 hypothetical protein [Pseudomonas sp. HB05]QXI53564.1 hypothetical protein KSS97_00990 [Pseudomonas alvandae]
MLGIVLGVAPAFIILGAVKGMQPWRIWTLIAGLALVIHATLMVGIMTDFVSLFEALQVQGKLTGEIASNAQKHLALWTIMFPAIVGAIGANYLTAWFQSNKP